MSKKLIRLDLEEVKRNVSGFSGYRRILFLNDYEKQLELESRNVDKKGGERVVAAMHEDGLDTSSVEYSEETITRYQW